METPTTTLTTGQIVGYRRPTPGGGHTDIVGTITHIDPNPRGRTHLDDITIGTSTGPATVKAFLIHEWLARQTPATTITVGDTVRHPAGETGVVLDIYTPNAGYPCVKFETDQLDDFGGFLIVIAPLSDVTKVAPR